MNGRLESTPALQPSISSKWRQRPPSCPVTQRLFPATDHTERMFLKANSKYLESVRLVTQVVGKNKHDHSSTYEPHAHKDTTPVSECLNVHFRFSMALKRKTSRVYCSTSQACLHNVLTLHSSFVSMIFNLVQTSRSCISPWIWRYSATPGVAL